MGYVFNSNSTKSVFVSDSEAESLRLAAADLVKDINSTCGKAVLTKDFSSADIVVCSDESEIFNDFADGVKFTHEEEFLYRVKEDKIIICGKGDLGAMWGIYTFSEKELGIPPYYLFDDFKPEKREKLMLEQKEVSEFPHTRFRGWFINDEDLLDGFMHKGTRTVQYTFYNNVIHPDLMEMIAETALRFRMNLLIPSSLIDIDNPPEENLVRIISRRGLYVSQHHIEPLGAFAHGIKRFFNERGYDENISYISNKEALVECWKHYAEGWAKYPRVIWQLGLRGMDDKPVWKADSAVGQSDKARGALISEAIQTQYDIVAAASKTKEIYTTSTVWMEGAHLLSVGALQLPASTVTVFADIGMSQLFGNDFFNTERLSGREYGIYYHAAYWHTGPHLAEGVLPQKMQYCYELARKYRSDYYSIMNVGNIKEFTYSINLNSKLVWYGGEADYKSVQKEYCKTYAGENYREMSRAIDLYFESLGSVDKEEFKKFCKKYDFDYREYHDINFPEVCLNDGIMYWCLRNEFNYKKDFYTEAFGVTVREGLIKAAKSNEIFEEVAKKLPESFKEALQRQWCYQSYLWKCFFSAAKLLCDLIERSDTMTEEDFVSVHKKVAECYADILAERKKYYFGKWQKWFEGDGKVSVKNLYEACLSEIAHVKDYVK